MAYRKAPHLLHPRTRRRPGFGVIERRARCIRCRLGPPESMVKDFDSGEEWGPFCTDCAAAVVDELQAEPS